MPKTTVTITPDVKLQRRLAAMSEQIVEMAADVNANAALVAERGEVIDDLRRQIDRKDGIIEQWKREELDNDALRKELEATSAMLSAAERDLQATQRDLDEANATIARLRSEDRWLPDMNGLRIWWSDNDLLAKDHTIYISKDGVTVDFLLPEGYALCCKVTQ